MTDFFEEVAHDRIRDAHERGALSDGKDSPDMIDGLNRVFDAVLDNWSDICRYLHDVGGLRTGVSGREGGEPHD